MMRQDHGAEEKDGFLDQGVGVSKHDIISWMSITGSVLPVSERALWSSDRTAWESH